MFLERFKEVENFTITKLPLGGSKIENVISLSKIGLQFKSWAILSEIVYIYSIHIVFCLNYIFLFL